MNGELRWDGLRVMVPAAWEPAVLDRGFIRLAGRDGQSVELRFGPEKGPFDPARDGLRLLRAAGLEETALKPCREPWCREIQADALQGGRLYVLRFRETGGVVAALFSSHRPADALRDMLTSLDWTPPDRWRDWACFDLRFETPPRASLAGASFRPGAFRLDFRLGSSELAFQRLSPADVLLAGSGLTAWLERFLRREQDVELAVTRQEDNEARFAQRPGPLGRLLPGLPGTGPRLRGMARHDAGHNKILILTERGRPCPQPVYDRITASYAATTIQD
jgi:hypothetical protein